MFILSDRLILFRDIKCSRNRNHFNLFDLYILTTGKCQVKGVLQVEMLLILDRDFT